MPDPKRALPASCTASRDTELETASTALTTAGAAVETDAGAVLMISLVIVLLQGVIAERQFINPGSHRSVKERYYISIRLHGCVLYLILFSIFGSFAMSAAPLSIVTIVVAEHAIVVSSGTHGRTIRPAYQQAAAGREPGAATTTAVLWYDSCFY